jgi:hypothetical protein
MDIFLTILAIISYLSIGTLFKVYYKLYRHDGILSEEPYIIGFFWPIYVVVRIVMALAKLAFYPFVRASIFLEKKVEEVQNLRRLASQQARVRIQSQPDKELREAEYELEEYLNKKERYGSL